MKSTIEPVNQYDVEREFYDFLQRPENYGFNAAFARQLGHKDDAHVSRMHSPHVPETPSWLYKVAVKFNAAAAANPRVARFALSILNRIIARHSDEPRASEDHELLALTREFIGAMKDADDGYTSRSDAERVRERLAEFIAGYGRQASREKAML